MSILFTHPGAWSGGFFEFAFRLPESANIFINEALAKLWTVPELNGCFLKNDMEPENQEKYSPGL